MPDRATSVFPSGFLFFIPLNPISHSAIINIHPILVVLHYKTERLIRIIAHWVTSAVPLSPLRTVEKSYDFNEWLIKRIRNERQNWVRFKTLSKATRIQNVECLLYLQDDVYFVADVETGLVIIQLAMPKYQARIVYFVESYVRM